MAGEENIVKSSLKEALYENLSALLSSNQKLRTAAEDQLKVFEVTDDYGVHLTEFSVDTQFPQDVRQLASVLLKQYVVSHWDPLAENKFVPPETTPEAKALIRNVLHNGLGDTCRKVRVSVAYAVSAIAQCDWPDRWPNLFDLLMRLISSGEPNAVHGAMRVLAEFSREITDQQMPALAPILLPHMYTIFTKDQVYGIRTRGRAIDILCTCMEIISSQEDHHRGVAKSLLGPVLPQLVDVLTNGLVVPNGPASDSGLKKEILKLISLLVKQFPKLLTPILGKVLPPVWKTLTESANFYIRTAVNCEEDSPEIVDSDGEVLSFEKLVLEVFEFVHALVECNKYKSTVRQSLCDLLHYIILYMEMTHEQVVTWSEDADRFVEDEDEESFSYSIRISAQDLLMTLSSEFRKETGPSICAVVTRHIQLANEERHKGNVHWWKLYESSLLALGSCRKLVIDLSHIKKTFEFDACAFIKTLVLPMLNEDVSPFLHGRCIWVTSRFACLLDKEVAMQSLHATVHALGPDQPAVLRISALRAMYNFCEHYSSINDLEMMKTFIGPMMEGILHLLECCNNEVLALALETCCELLAVDKDFTASCEGRLTPILLSIFLRHSNDPMLVSLCEDTFQELSENERCVYPLQTRLLPTLISVLTTPRDKVPEGLSATTLDIMTTMVRYSPLPLPAPMLEQAFPVVVHYTLHTDDHSAMESGANCLRAFVGRAPEQVLHWQDAKGHTGVQCVLEVISRLLDPKAPEVVADSAGRLVAKVISRLGKDLGQNLDMLLRSVLSKLQLTETTTSTQSLVLVYAHLINHQLEAVLNFLMAVPDPQGRPALQLVMREWCAKQHLFYGSYDCKVSCLALSRLLQHAVNTNDQRLQNFDVIAEQQDLSEGVRTRAKAKNNQQWTKIPVLIKIYKLLIHELSNQIEQKLVLLEKNETYDHDNDDEDTGVDDDEEEDEEYYGGQLVSMLSNVQLLGDVIDDSDDDDNVDRDKANDPLYQVNLQTYLTGFLKEFSQHPASQVFLQHCDANELKVLKTAQIINF